MLLSTIIYIIDYMKSVNVLICYSIASVKLLICVQYNKIYYHYILIFLCLAENIQKNIPSFLYRSFMQIIYNKNQYMMPKLERK